MYSTPSLILIAALAFANGAMPHAPSLTLAHSSAKVQNSFEQDFSSFDHNGDGLLSRAETHGAKWLNRFFDNIDADRNNLLSKNEIYSYGMKVRKEQTFSFDERFKSADKDGDNALTLHEAEAGQMMRVALRFETIDADGDGRVTLEELRAYLKRHIQTGPMI